MPFPLFESSERAGGPIHTFLKPAKNTSLQFNVENAITNTNLGKFVPMTADLITLAAATSGSGFLKGLADAAVNLGLAGRGFVDELDQAVAADPSILGSGFGQLIKEPADTSFIEKPIPVPTLVGTGIFSRLTGLLNKATNLLPSSDKNARPQFPGEKHAIFKLGNNLPGRANYAGPGTRILERIKRNDPPRVLTDKVAQAHDIRYALADDTGDIRRADLQMIEKLKQIRSAGTDSKLNTDPSLRIIQGKVLAERFSLLDRAKFASFDPDMGEKDKEILKNKLSTLSQEGFGKSGSALRKKLLRRLL
jgi:hypothetical protein